MSRFLIVGAVALAALSVVSGASAAQKRPTGVEHSYYWIDTPKAEREYACQARDLWALINRGDLCQAYDQPTSPPIYTP
jgi:hypothetical protein